MNPDRFSPGPRVRVCWGQVMAVHNRVKVIMTGSARDPESGVCWGQAMAVKNSVKLIMKRETVGT